MKANCDYTGSCTCPYEIFKELEIELSMYIMGIVY